MLKARNIITIFLFVLFAGISSVFANTSSTELSNDRISSTDIVFGNKDAQILFIEYSSPTCLHCLDYHLNIFPELKRKYIDTGKIAYVIRDLVGNKQDLDASILARCKGDVDAQLKITSNLLLTQDSWAYSSNYKAKLYNIAKEHGITGEQYDLCLKDDSKSQIQIDHTKFVFKDKDFLGTPSFYINGELYQGEYTTTGISDFLETLLTAAENLNSYGGLKKGRDYGEHSLRMPTPVEYAFHLGRNYISQTLLLPSEFKNALEEIRECFRPLRHEVDQVAMEAILTTELKKPKEALEEKRGFPPEVEKTLKELEQMAREVNEAMYRDKNNVTKANHFYI